MKYHTIPCNTKQYKAIQHHAITTCVSSAFVFHFSSCKCLLTCFSRQAKISQTFHFYFSPLPRHFDVGMFHYIDILLDFFTILHNVYNISHWNDWISFSLFLILRQKAKAFKMSPFSLHWQLMDTISLHLIRSNIFSNIWYVSTPFHYVWFVPT